ncbi:MAG: protein-methionine-sulfoxide reductase catalytic subunit MsrP [Gemmatimonadetes bacterium]|nr:protein-methionine-sulfoxide reductase catalytic subunit MsrP [Gemmatimonadota bacterium]
MANRSEAKVSEGAGRRVGGGADGSGVGANILIRPGWWLPEREATPESVYWNRRSFLRAAGFGATALGLGGLGGLSACGPGLGRSTDGGAPQGAAQTPADPLATIPATPTADLYPSAPRDPRFTLDRPITDRVVAASHNNFYEFLTDKGDAWRHTGPFQARPWTVEIAGLVDNPGVHDVADLEREFGLEERLYRHRCVEAWAMAVPWTGYPLSKLIAKAQPLSAARYVRFVSFYAPEQAIGQQTQPWYPWPYYEGLRMDEAMNELTFVVTGVFGAPLPKQHGAPLRIATPWKYGYKSAKSFLRMEFIAEQPPTLWNDVAPDEYGFYSNVNPNVPHPRWSQATEELIGTGERRPTLLFNGYGEWVADMYDPQLLTYRS